MANYVADLQPELAVNYCKLVVVWTDNPASTHPARWRTCWQQGRAAVDFLSQLLRGPPPQDGAIFGLKVWPADAAVGCLG